VSSRVCAIRSGTHVVTLGAGQGGEGHPVDPRREEALASRRAEEVGAFAGREAESARVSIDWGAWRSRIWVAALAITAWPHGSRHATSQ
jgi:hypothetical protein